MTDQVLTISEVRTPRTALPVLRTRPVGGVERGAHTRAPTDGRRSPPGRPPELVGDDADGPSCRHPVPRHRAPPAKGAAQAGQGARGRATRLVMLEPRPRRGAHDRTRRRRHDRPRPRLHDHASTTTPTSPNATSGSSTSTASPWWRTWAPPTARSTTAAKLTGTKLLHPGDRVQVGTTVIEAQ